MSKRKPRFPGIDWWCDRCDAFLNDQENFDDHHYVWKCTECGYKNSISSANIIWGKPVFEPFGKILGWLRSVVVYAIIAVLIQIFLNADVPLVTYILPYRIYLYSGYAALIVISMIFEKAIAKYCSEMNILYYILSTPFVNLWSDICRPFNAVFNAINVIKTFSIYKKYLFLFGELIDLIIYLPLVILIIGYLYFLIIGFIK